MDSDLERIQDREKPGEVGPWRWQLISVLERIATAVEKGFGDQLSDEERQKQISEKRREAGRLGAEKKKQNLAKLANASFAKVANQANASFARKPRKPKTDGSSVWNAYELAYQRRYNVSPLRNAKSNRHCSDIVNQVGLEHGCQLVTYYVQSNDQYFVRDHHPLSICLMKLQKLSTELKTGKTVTGNDARRIETHSQIDRAIQQYAEQQEIEHVAPRTDG